MRRIINGIFILPVKIYQWIISPILPASCRYHPTCSAYMITAIQQWGPLKGGWMGLKRMITCHPWGGMGHDPVPENPKRKK
jgi:putative membrane protein insertion efficiency factor